MHLYLASKKLTEYEYHDVLFHCNCSYWSAWAVIISVIHIINVIISIPVPWVSIVFVVKTGVIFMSPGKLIKSIHILVFFKLKILLQKLFQWCGIFYTYLSPQNWSVSDTVRKPASFVFFSSIVTIVQSELEHPLTLPIMKIDNQIIKEKRYLK